MCEANLAGSFQKASRLLESLANMPVSDKQVQLHTERVGRVMEEERRQATDEYLRLRVAPSPSARPARETGPALLVISMDGGRVQTRQEDPKDKWKEDKVAVVYEAIPAPECPGVEYHGPPGTAP